MLKNLLYSKQFDKIFKENYKRLYIYALHVIGDAETCHDIVEEIFTDIWENIDKLNIDTIHSYLNTSVHHRCIDYLRHQIVEQKYTDEYISSLSEFYKDNKEKEKQDYTIKKMLEMLPPVTRLILEECYLNQKKYSEVAEEMNISPSTVKKHIIKAFKILREFYKDKYY